MMKVAIVHDFLMQMGGAEKVVEVLHDMFPEAPIYTSAFEPDAMPIYYRAWDIRTSFLQRLILKKYSHRAALLLYPAAFESFDLSEYDLVISSSSAFAKGVVTQPHTTHVCYTHTPMRYVWSTRTYVKNERLSNPARALLVPGLHYLRTWDSISSDRVDHFVGNSSAVARRVEKFYRRRCDVVHPPVDTDRFSIAEEVGDYYIMVSRFVPYKRVDLAVEAFTAMDRPLKVVGTGRQMKALKAKAGPKVEFLGRVDDVELPGLIARSRGYIMPGEEDFGIAPVEANACGRPVIAFAAGGALDVQIDGVTGVLFHQQTVEALSEAVERAESIEWNPQLIKENSLRFTTDMFRLRMQQIIDAAMARKGTGGHFKEGHGQGHDYPADLLQKSVHHSDVASMLANGRANGYLPHGHVATVHGVNGDGVNGHSANGHSANGHNVNGHSNNGHDSNGHDSNGHNGHHLNGNGAGHHLE